MIMKEMKHVSKTTYFIFECPLNYVHMYSVVTFDSTWKTLVLKFSLSLKPLFVCGWFHSYHINIRLTKHLTSEICIK